MQRHCTVIALNRASLKLIRDTGLRFKTIPSENGTRLQGYKALKEATSVRCYVSYPHLTWGARQH